jgi:Undecaprenyl-phosphate galactose phosphotransferase WbaP
LHSFDQRAHALAVANPATAFAPPVNVPVTAMPDPLAIPETACQTPSSGSFAASDDDASHLKSLNSVLQEHTANQPNLRLNLDLILQSLCTGIPLLVVDLMIAATAMLAAASVINLWQGHPFNPGVWIQLPAWLVTQTGLIWLHGLYPGAGIAAVTELRGVVRSAVYSCLCLSSLNLIFGHLPRIEFAIFVATTAIVMTVLPLARHLSRAMLAMTSWWGIRALMIGSRTACTRLCRQVQSRRESGLIVIGYVCNEQDFQKHAGEEENLLGSGIDALSIASRMRAPIAAMASVEAQALAQRLMFQFPSLVWMDSSAMFSETSNPIGEFSRRLNVPFLRFTPRLLKRTLDLALVVPGLLLLAVPMAIIAIAIKWKSPGPIIYGSPRIGQHGRRFKMWKFRSMVPDADNVLKQRLDSDPAARAEWAADNKLKNDPRIIPGIGRILRSSSLDELPQLWNVLVGQMSLVGPRPVPPGEIVKYQDQYYQYSHMWPGITGLWQVSGRNDTTFEARVFLVGHYAANWSMWLDAWILVKTPMTVITRKGAY